MWQKPDIVNQLYSNNNFKYIYMCVYIYVYVYIWTAYVCSSWGSHGKYAGVVCHSLLQWITLCQNLSAMTRLPWVALHSMAHSFIELRKSLRHKAVILEGDQEINMRWKEYTEELYKKDLNEPDYCDGVVSPPEPDILEWEDKQGLKSTAVNKPSGCDEIPAELFKSLKDDTIKVLHSLCQQIWKKTQ